MNADDTLLARIAEADPARYAGPSDLERLELADRVRQRVRQAGHRPSPRRSRPGIASIVTVAGSALIILAVGGLILGGHHRAPSPTATRPSHPQTVHGATGTFAALARPRSRRDRLPAVLDQRTTQRPGHLPKLDSGRSALVIATSTQREWLVPAAKQQLCIVQLNLTRGRRLGDGSFGEGCIGRRYADLHGVAVGESTTTFDAVLPEHTSPVTVTFTDRSSIELHANANGVITRHFSKPAQAISYTGPTGRQVHVKPYAGPTGLQMHLKRCAHHEQQPCIP
jgi:hypothetical protein